MIYTCTLNPSIDYLIETDEIHLGSLNRIDQSLFLPGGKGINVSRVLNHLGKKSTAIGFLGGFTGEFIKNYLTAEGINHDFIAHEEPTRINVKLKAEVETEINGSGAFIAEDQQQQLSNRINQLTERDFLVLAGSLPPSVPSTFYRSIANECHEKNIPFVVDVSGEPLRELLEFRPFLIKPNHHELGELVGTEISSLEQAAHYGKKLLQNGPRNIIVSMGGDGAVFVNDEITAYATVPNGELKNSVGAGDSTVAGFLAAYVEHGDLMAAFEYGVAAGTATAFSTDLCTQEEVDRLLEHITVKTR